MWHQSGSPIFYMEDDMANWLAALNRSKYAGFSDWRLPTLEEAATLIEKNNEQGPVGQILETKSRLYINNLFSANQIDIWTGHGGTHVWDNNIKSRWEVSFWYGRYEMGSESKDYNTVSIRPVRKIR